MVDAADKLRVKVAKNELELLLESPSLQEREVPMLFYANKMDLNGAMGSADVSDLLGLE